MGICQNKSSIRASSNGGKPNRKYTFHVYALIFANWERYNFRRQSPRARRTRVPERERKLCEKKLTLSTNTSDDELKLIFHFQGLNCKRSFERLDSYSEGSGRKAEMCHKRNNKFSQSALWSFSISPSISPLFSSMTLFILAGSRIWRIRLFRVNCNILLHLRSCDFS